MYQNNRSFQTNRQPNRNQQFRSRRVRQLDTSLLIRKAKTQEREEFIPVNTFGEFPFHEQLKQNIQDRGYITPTPIQDKAIPELLLGKDVVGIANTGTGKTAAFLLPLIQKAFLDRTQKVLIIVPTRELAVQIEDEFRIFAKNMQLYSVLVIGGVNMYRQITNLRRNPNFVIGTPGRLKDLEKQKRLHLEEYHTIVLDEVDRMLDMGFIGDIRYITEKLPENRHSLFFSATVPDTIRDMMRQLVRNPVVISIKTQESSDHVNQDVIRTNGKPKIDLLHDLLIQDGFNKVLLFGRTKFGIEKLQRALEERGFRVAAIHGNKKQSQRQRALDAFKDNRIQILLATDIASRGIDVSDVTHVINYDMPESYEDYVHRIGRTGRADKFGTALTFID